MSNNTPDRKEVGWVLVSRNRSKFNPAGATRSWLVPREPDDKTADPVKIVFTHPKPFALSKIYEMMSHWYDVPGENETSRLTYGLTERERIDVGWIMERVIVTRYDISAKVPESAATEVHEVLLKHWGVLAAEMDLPDCKMNLTLESTLRLLQKHFGC